MSAEETLKREIRKVLAQMQEGRREVPEELEERVLALLTEKDDKEYAAKLGDFRATLKEFLLAKHANSVASY